MNSTSARPGPTPAGSGPTTAPAATSRGLKHRAEGESRRVPCPPALTKLLREHLAEFGGEPAEPLFRGVQGRPLATITYRRAWDKARASSADGRGIPLAAGSPALRPAARVPVHLAQRRSRPTQVAEWAGHSVEVLLRVYAKCLDGQDEIARRRIVAALDGVEE